MHNTSAREASSPRSTAAGMLSPGLISHSSNHTRRPLALSLLAIGRTLRLSLELWLTKTSYSKDLALMASGAYATAKIYSSAAGVRHERVGRHEPNHKACARWNAAEAE